jgi:hypothetical protein
MDENKVIKLNTKTIDEGQKIEKTKAKPSLFQTNPILHEMFTSNMNNKKNKFEFKDLFK